MLVKCPCIKQILSGLSDYTYTLALIFILSGCVSLPQPTVSLNSSAHQLSLKQQNHWSVKGKLGFKSPEKKNRSANFRWQQSQKQYKINLFMPIIGKSLLNIQGDKNGVTLVTDDKTYQDSDPSYLIWLETGWRIPVEKLRFWIKGQHHKHDKVLTSKEGWVSQLQPICNNCKHWLINYDNYKLIDYVWLPHKMVLKNSLDNSQLIIKVNEWNLHE